MLSNLFDFIASNFVIVLIILGGLFSFFQDKKKKEAEAEQQAKNPQSPQQQQRPDAPHQRGRKPAIPELRRMQRAGNGNSQESAARDKQLRETGSEAMAEAQKMLEMANEAERIAEQDRKRGMMQSRKPIARRRHANPLFRNGLDRAKLAESVVMSEVLGLPRALKRHAPGRQSNRR